MPGISAKVGDLVEIFSENRTVKGIVMPSDKEKIVLKLDSGYNTSIKKTNIQKIKLIEKYKEERFLTHEIKIDPKKPTISILHTGGTIASKVDYRTGAVVSRFSPEDLLGMFPELKNLANIKSKLVFQMFSEDIEPEHWLILAKEIEKEIKSGVDGIIITHGTDTMPYTSAALSFMLQNSPIPIIIVGAQRSSDRPSSDAFLNLICAANFIVNSNFSGIAVCMHASMQDDYCYVHSGVRLRKLHTSRRDAFRSINIEPIAKVWKNKIEMMKKDHAIKDKKRKLNSKICFNKNISILKSRPGLTSKEVNFFKKYDGIVLEGTGLGHFPVNSIDKYTQDHKKILDSIKSICKKSLVVMASQTIFGRVNMNVYSTGRDLQEVGVIPAEDMLTEVAYVKLGWILAQTKNLKKAREMFSENYAGEITKRILIEEDFLE